MLWATEKWRKQHFFYSWNSLKRLKLLTYSAENVNQSESCSLSVLFNAAQIFWQQISLKNLNLLSCLKGILGNFLFLMFSSNENLSICEIKTCKPSKNKKFKHVECILQDKSMIFTLNGELLITGKGSELCFTDFETEDGECSGFQSV